MSAVLCKTPKLCWCVYFITRKGFSFVDLSQESCQEEKILYKLISGLHSSISVHIGADYLLDEATNMVNLLFLFSEVAETLFTMWKAFSEIFCIHFNLLKGDKILTFLSFLFIILVGTKSDFVVWPSPTIPRSCQKFVFHFSLCPASSNQSEYKLPWF
jgi:hypothetical protein